jgi:hypothetical protein
MKRVTWVCLACFVSLASGGDFDGDRASQQAARTLATEMLTELIDRQLQQLVENRLADSPLHADVASMRRRIATLVDTEMSGVMRLLEQAGQATGAKRTEFLARAHQKMRLVLRQLLAERERIQIRRRRAQLIAPIEAVIAHQHRTRDATLLLDAASEQQQLNTIAAQQNIVLLQTHLVRLLARASEWPGPIGASATQANQAQQAMGVTTEAALAVDALKSSEFTEAAQSQQRVLEGWESILRQFRKSSDPLAVHRNPIPKLKKIIRQQQAFQKAMRDEPLTDATAAAHVQTQRQLSQQIDQARAAMRGNPQAKMLFERASAASEQATEKLFSLERREALNQQGRVIGALDALVQQLKTDDSAAAGSRSAASYETQAKILAEAGRKLSSALESQKQATASAESNPASAADKERQVAKIARDVAAEPALSEALKTRVEQAASLAAAAKASLATRAPERVAKTKQAEKQLRKAIGEVARAERNAKRNALAMKVGELNRAAETLERTAAASRNPGATESKDESKQRAKVADAISLDVARAIPETAKAAQAKLAEARRPDAPLKAKADALEQAADAVRAKMSETAGELERKTEGDLAQSQSLAKALDKTLAKTPTPKQLAEAARTMATDSPNVSAALDDAAREAGKVGDEAKDRASSAMQRARVLNEMETDELAAQRDQARAMKKAVDTQASSSDAIRRQREQFAQAVAKNKDRDARDDPTVAAAAQKLQKAIADHAAALDETGRLAEMMTQQHELGNAMLANAVQSAAELPLDNTAPPKDTGLVPQQPSQTARAMAGAAGESVRSLLEELSSSVPDESAFASPTASTGATQKPIAGKGGQESSKKPTPPGGQASRGVFREGSSDETTIVTDRPATQPDTEEPWSATLPKAVRKGMLTEGKKPMPRGYEKRLKTYFETME